MQQVQAQDAFIGILAWFWEQVLLMFDIGKEFFVAPAKLWHILVVMYLLDKYQGRIEGRLEKIMWLLTKWENER